MAQLKRTNFGQVDLEYVLGVGGFDLERFSLIPFLIYGITSASSWVYAHSLMCNTLNRLGASNLNYNSWMFLCFWWKRMFICYSC